jgi:hypothetical protein
MRTTVAAVIWGLVSLIPPPACLLFFLFNLVGVCVYVYVSRGLGVSALIAHNSLAKAAAIGLTESGVVVQILNVGKELASVIGESVFGISRNNQGFFFFPSSQRCVCVCVRKQGPFVR